LETTRPLQVQGAGLGSLQQAWIPASGAVVAAAVATVVYLLHCPVLLEDRWVAAATRARPVGLYPAVAPVDLGIFGGPSMSATFQTQAPEVCRAAAAAALPDVKDCSRSERTIELRSS
jgi:hypothetical protein